jgi:hypothetical protein
MRGAAGTPSRADETTQAKAGNGAREAFVVAV